MLHLMNYGMVMLPMLNISKSLVVDVIYWNIIEIENLMQKSDEGIFLGYSTKRKAYKCLNSNTNKVVKSENVEVDEFAERSGISCIKESKDYSTFIYVDDDAPST